MEYIYRALNEYDFELKPLENGLVNKKTIDNATSYVHDFLFFNSKVVEEVYGNYENISLKEFKEIYDSLKSTYISGVISFIVEEVHNKQKEVDKILNQLQNSEEALIDFVDILSTLQTHLHHGSRVDTPWISFSKELLEIKKYYLTQKKHGVAVVKSEIDSIFDFSNGQTLIAYDLSSREKVLSNDFLFNKGIKMSFCSPTMYRKTNKNSRGIHYAVDAKEVLYYHHVPKEKVLAVLHPLEVDLLRNGMLDLQVYEKSRIYATYFYKQLLNNLKNYIKEEQLLYLLEEHYRNETPIQSLSDSYLDQQNLIQGKKRILELLPKIPNKLIKDNLPREIKVMEE